jgi:hypothetical protein
MTPNVAVANGGPLQACYAVRRDRALALACPRQVDADDWSAGQQGQVTLVSTQSRCARRAVHLSPAHEWLD